MASKEVVVAEVVPQSELESQFTPQPPRRKNDPLNGVIPPAKAPVMPHQRHELEELIRACVDTPLSRRDVERLAYIFRRAHGQGVAAGMKAKKDKA